MGHLLEAHLIWAHLRWAWCHLSISRVSSQGPPCSSASSPSPSPGGPISLGSGSSQKQGGGITSGKPSATQSQELVDKCHRLLTCTRTILRGLLHSSSEVPRVLSLSCPQWHVLCCLCLLYFTPHSYIPDSKSHSKWTTCLRLFF